MPNTNLPTPYSYQKKTIDFLTDVAKNQGACFVFDETGLGKTIISAHIANNLAPEGNILVVSPKINFANWQKILPSAEICTKQKVTKKSFDVVVVDEAHAYKNIDGKLYKELFEVIWLQNPDKFPYVILVTATPYNNTSRELAAMFSLCPFKPSSPAFWVLPESIDRILAKEKRLKKYNNSLKKDNLYSDDLQTITMN